MNNGTFSASSKVTPHWRRYYLAAIPLLLLISFAAPSIFSQEDDTDAAAPPLKLVPKAEVSQLSAESDLKGRAKLTLSLMEDHLAVAERLSTSGGDAKGAFRELGVFQALMEDSLAFLEKNDLSSGKTLDALRKFEIGLRAFMPRLETVRRDLPLNCDEYVHKLMTSLRDVRAKAIDPMFSDNVVRVKDDR